MTPSRTNPGIAYELIHHQNPFDPSTSSLSTSLGTFFSFTAAQTAAADAFAKWYNEIGLNEMIPFEIRLFEVLTDVWTPAMGCEESDALFLPQEDEIKIVCKMPPKSSVSTRLPPLRDVRSTEECELEQEEEYGPVFKEESEAHWTQTRIPYFRKRDEGPFRDSSDPPYRQEMGFVKALNMPVGEMVQIVVEQPDELDEEELSVQGSELDSGEDIGPIYRGRRHSAPGLGVERGLVDGMLTAAGLSCASI